MNSQAQMEISFWRDEFRKRGTPEAFIQQRREDWADFEKHFPPLAAYLREPVADGSRFKQVLEIGTGLISPLEFSDALHTEITGVDPLKDEYQQIIDLNGRPVRYQTQSGEALAFEGNVFDAVVCINVIDHTPNPHLLLEEAYRVLKPGGKMFFEVNFDGALSPAHYGIWNLAMVEEAFKAREWRFVEAFTDERPEHNQTRYWAVYEK